MRKKRKLALASGVLVATTLAMAASTAAPISNAFASTSSSKVLTLWNWRPQDDPGLYAVGRLFQKETGFHLQISTSTSDAVYYTKLEAAARTGTLPDTLSLNYGGVGGDDAWGLAEAGLLENLTADFTPSWRAEMAPSALANGAITSAVIAAAGTGADSLSNLKPGQIYAIPYMAGSASMVYVRKSALRAAKLSTTRPPTSYQQWVSEIAATVKALGPKGGIVTGLQNPGTLWSWLLNPIQYSYLGAKAYDSIQSLHPVVPFGSAKSVALLKLLNDMSNLWIPGALALNITPAHDAFVAGKASWYLGGTFSLSGIIGGGVSPSNLMAFPVPGVAGGAVPKLQYGEIGLVQEAIPKMSKEPKAALEFIKLLTSPTGAAIFAKYGHNVPATRLSKAALEKADPLVAGMYDSLVQRAGFNPYATTDGPPTPVSVSSVADVTLEELVAHTATPQQVGTKIQEEYAAGWKSLGK